ncbi:MAG: hypothetical protein ACRD22_08880 [Terriglobia bacterium]
MTEQYSGAMLNTCGGCGRPPVLYRDSSNHFQIVCVTVECSSKKAVFRDGIEMAAAAWNDAQKGTPEAFCITQGYDGKGKPLNGWCAC